MSSNQPTLDYLRKLADQRFWGTVKLQLQAGEVIHLTEERSLKPNQLEPEYRRNHESINRQ
jgi:hypothetical protein